MAQSVIASHRSMNLSSIPRSTQGWRCTLGIPGLVRQRQADSWGSLAKQPSQTDEFQASEEHYLIKEDGQHLINGPRG